MVRKGMAGEGEGERVTPVTGEKRVELSFGFANLRSCMKWSETQQPGLF